VKPVVLTVIAAAVLAFVFVRMTADAATPSTIPARVAKLERQVKQLRGNVSSLTAQVIQLQRNDQTAAEAESNLEARVSALEQSKSSTP